MSQMIQSEVASSYASSTKTFTNEKTDTKKSKVSGATIGSPELSDKAKKYYEQLKKKYSNMDFILVSEDKKAEAQANAGKYANANRMVVLIDTEKIERMAEDESYRKQYEAIIGNAASKLPQMMKSLGQNASSVKTFGMQVNSNGMTSFFAVVDKSLAAQKARIEKNAAKKAADKKEAKKAAEEKRAEKRKEANQANRQDKIQEDSEDTVTVTASSMEELIRKVNEAISMGMSDYVRTEEELQVGGHIDFYG